MDGLFHAKSRSKKIKVDDFGASPFVETPIYFRDFLQFFHGDVPVRKVSVSLPKAVVARLGNTLLKPTVI